MYLPNRAWLDFEILEIRKHQDNIMFEEEKYATRVRYPKIIIYLKITVWGIVLTELELLGTSI